MFKYSSLVSILFITCSFSGNLLAMKRAHSEQEANNRLTLKSTTAPVPFCYFDLLPKEIRTEILQSDITTWNNLAKVNKEFNEITNNSIAHRIFVHTLNVRYGIPTAISSQEITTKASRLYLQYNRLIKKIIKSLALNLLPLFKRLGEDIAYKNNTFIKNAIKDGEGLTVLQTLSKLFELPPADIHYTDKKGSFLHRAVTNFNPAGNVLEVLNPQPRVLDDQKEKLKFDILKCIMAKNPDFNATNCRGDTALMCTPTNHALQAILIDHTNLEIVNYKGKNAFMIVAESGKPETIDLYIKKGADLFKQYAIITYTIQGGIRLQKYSTSAAHVLAKRFASDSSLLEEKWGIQLKVPVNPARKKLF